MRKVVQYSDALINRRKGLFEFSQNPECLFLLQKATASHRLSLPDCQVERGEQVFFLHLWNDRLLTLDTQSPGLGWARTIQRLFHISIMEVAEYLEDHHELVNVRAIGGVTVFIDHGTQKGGTRYVERYGFTVMPYRSSLGSFGEFWGTLFHWIVIWAYNPSSLPTRNMKKLRRKEFWISSREFRRRMSAYRGLTQPEPIG